jgi:aarF domain-containing kinase
MPFAYKSFQVSMASEKSEEVRAELRAEWCKALIDALNQAGMSMIKFGQWISMRPDMFPADLIEALKGLRDDVPPHSYEETIHQVEESFGKKWSEIFEEISVEAVASGSVGQVHRAKLLPQYAMPDGSTEVALKVRHPGALDQSYIDIYLIFGSLPFINFFSSLRSSEDSPNISIPFAIDAFHSILQRQVDFRWEAYNLIKFVRNFGREVRMASNSIRFPYVCVDVLSETVLVESWAEGTTISDLFDGEKNAGTVLVFAPFVLHSRRAVGTHTVALRVQLGLTL